ncbi:MAG: DNA polymerase III subunit delta' [Lachnospiraceae bacterium]|jgi:DNA polymerase-3 subunit delta'
MAGFDKVLGHEEIIKHLQNAVFMDKVSHAYIFDGEEKSGKKLLANLFAMTLQCEAGRTEPCFQCSSCKKVQSRNHPDIIFLDHEKANLISIDEIRTQVVNDVAIKPYTGPYKIYIIDEAEKMNLQAQNAILKTIEEPPAYVVIMLLTSNISALLPTILSRCVTLHLKPVKDSLIRNYLMEEMQIPDYQADMSVAFAQGNVGKAKEIAASHQFREMTDHALYLLRNTPKMELYELVEAIKQLTQEKDSIYDYLDLFLLWFRDVLMFKATKEVDTLVFKKEINSIEERAKKSSYEGLEIIIEAIERAKVRLHANVNFELVMELLFLTIREN